MDRTASKRRTARPTLHAVSVLLTLAVVVVTLYPLAGWRSTGAHPLAFLGAGWPRFWTWFDLLSNVGAYALLAGLWTLGLRTRLAWAPIGVTLLGAALSLGLESAQTYLPSRVPSLLDWLANSGGAALGALLAHRLPEPASRRHAGVAGPTWFEQGPLSGWIVVLFWLVSQALPQRMLFATGRLDAWFEGAWHGAGGVAPWLRAWRNAWWEGPLPAGYGVGIEAAIVVCAVLGVGAVVLALVQSRPQRLRVLVGLAVGAFVLRSLATQKVYGAGAPLAWLTPGAQGGLVMGAVLLYGLASLGGRVRSACAVLAILLGTLLVNLTPDDGYFRSTATDIQWGPLLHLRALLDLLASGWPALAIAWLLWQACRRPPPDWHP